MTTIKQYKTEITALLTLLAISWLIVANSLTAPITLNASKIEEDVIVQKNDSVTTVIIPDKRL